MVEPIPLLQKGSSDTLLKSAIGNKLIGRLNALAKMQILPADLGRVEFTEDQVVITINRSTLGEDGSLEVHNLGHPVAGADSEAGPLVTDPTPEETGINAKTFAAKNADLIVIEDHPDDRYILIKLKPTPDDGNFVINSASGVLSYAPAGDAYDTTEIIDINNDGQLVRITLPYVSIEEE